MMNELKMNPLAIVVCVVWMFVLGFTWYGPLFGEAWMGMVGLNMAEVEANPPGAGLWISNLIGSAVPIILLSWFFVKLKVESLATGVVYGVLIGFVFFQLPTMINGMFAQSPYELAWITGGFQTVGWTVAGGILGVWRKYK